MPKVQQKKLTIGLVLDDTLDVNDGVQQYVRIVGNWLASRGHDVHYIVGHSDQTSARVHSVGRLATVNFNGNKVRTPISINKKYLKHLLNKIQFDVLHVQMPHSPFLAQKIITSKLHNAAVVGTFHIMPYSVKEKVATRILGTALLPSLKRTTTLMAVSKPAAELAWYAFRKKAITVPNAVDVDAFRNVGNRRILKPDVINIVFLGRLVERKGCMHLLRSLVVLSQKNKLQNVHVTVCGDGPERTSLQKYVTENKLTELVTFVGFIDELDKPFYLKDADIAVFPSTGGESFGIVLIEAMAAGSSVVLAGDNPGYRSVMQGLEDQIVQPSHIVAFANTLEKYITNKDVRKVLQRKQTELVKRFDIKTVGKEIESIYYDAIAKK